MQQLFEFKKSESISEANRENTPGESLWFNGRHFTAEKPEGLAIDVRFPTPASTQLDFPIEHSLVKNYPLVWEILGNYYSDPLTSLTCSRTMLLPHQVEAAIAVLSSLSPRFLIADEVGLGKTIETGLIIKELILKHNFERILICVPSPLLYQWQTELRSKFNESFKIVSGMALRANEQIFYTEKKILVSVDLAKDERYREIFLSAQFELVVFDEAHRLRRDMSKTTKAWSFAEAMSRQAKSFLLLSATPFRGKIEEIYYLMYLLNPDLLGPIHTFMSRFLAGENVDIRKRISPVVIRRRKIDVGGFTKRFAKTVKITLDSQERAFYTATTDYVRLEFNRAMESGQRMKSFVMIVFQKLLDSSAHALLCALKRRKEKLEALYFRLSALENATETDEVNEHIQEMLFTTDEEESSTPEKIFDPKEIRTEIDAINRLIYLGSRIKKESKAEMLQKTISSMRKSGHKKFIIFTQFKSTLDFLKGKLDETFKVRVFHGSLSALEKEKSIEDFFSEADILICTEAGGEGRNLQAASALINYDLPWSPLKIEQRIGRIHRFGQTKDVYIVNYACKDTVAERVLEVLEDKIRLFEDTLGPSDTLLGAMENEVSFSGSIMNFLSRKKTRKEWDAELEKSLNLARDNLDKIDGLLSPEFMDFNLSEFRKLEKNGQFRKEENTNLLEQVFLETAELRDLEKGKNRIHSYQDSAGNNAVFTFCHATAEKNPQIDFLALGHPLVDTLLQKIKQVGERYSCWYLPGTSNRAVFHIQFSIRADKTYKRFYTATIENAVNPDKLILDQLESGLFPQPVVIEKVYYNELAEKALATILPKILDDSEKISARLQKAATGLRSDIQKSHGEREAEIEEKLQIQRGKSRWYGNNQMASAITRTLNQRREEDIRVEHRLAQLARNLRIELAVEFTSCFLYNNWGTEISISTNTMA